MPGQRSIRTIRKIRLEMRPPIMRTPHKRHLPGLSAVALAAVLAGTGGSAFADNSADLGHGHDLAHRWCASCHAIDAGETEGFLAKVPSFQALADQNSTTELSLRAFLQTPHPTMPNIKL